MNNLRYILCLVEMNFDVEYSSCESSKISQPGNLYEMEILLKR